MAKLLLLAIAVSSLFSTHGERALVLLFIRSDCPVSNRYAPEIQRLHTMYSHQGIEFRLVYAEPGLRTADMERHRHEYGYTIPALLDRDHYFSDRVRARMTPEAVVLIAGKPVYVGRIDDRYVDVGRERPRAVHHDLADVLAAIAAGRPVQYHETAAIGCAIEK